MKARIKETGQEIEVLSVYATISGYATHYDISDISFVDKPHTESSIDWEQRRFELVKSAMQGVLSSWTVGKPTPEVLIQQTFQYADTVLTEYMKGGEE